MKKWFLFLLLPTSLFAQLGANVSPCAFNFPVDSTTGTTANYYVKFNAGGVGVTLGATTDGKQAFIGIADQTVAAGGGQVLVHFCGPIKANFDGATTAGDSFTLSSSTAGALTDTGLAFNSTTCSTPGLGEITQTIGSAGVATAVIKPCIGAGTVASGTAAMGTSAISSGACATVVTVSASGVLTTDTIIFTPNANPTSVTGYAPSASGSVYIWGYPTANDVNFYVCNNTSGSRDTVGVDIELEGYSMKCLLMAVVFAGTMVAQVPLGGITGNWYHYRSRSFRQHRRSVQHHDIPA